MGKFKLYKPGKPLNIRLDINQAIAENHLCRFIELIVSGLDTTKIEDDYSPYGQNALHPKMLLSIIFYGYATGVRSGRKLAISCAEELPYIYLSKGYYPKKTAINEFRRKYYLYFDDLFNQVVGIAGNHGLGEFSFSIGDGSKIEANSSKSRTKSIQQLTKWKEILMEDIKELETELEQENLITKEEEFKKN